MGYLSKAAILRAYKALSELTNDPTAQGATQATSALRYLFALDEFVKNNGRDCDTSIREDRDLYISYVGNVVAINNDYYTANFFNAIKDNQDYAVGSNFFSVNVVKSSIVSPSTEFTFPKRGNNPLFKVKGGKLIEDKSLLLNLKEYLHTSELRNAFALWLVRFESLNKDNIFDSIIEKLKKRYSNSIIGELMIDKQVIMQYVGDSLNDNPYSLSISDFESFLTKNNNTTDKAPIQDKKLLAEEIKKSFIDYFSNYLRLSTGKCEDTKIEMYLNIYSRQVETPLKEKFPDFNSIFEFQDVTSLDNFLFVAQEELPKLSVLLFDKWRQDKEIGNVSYEAWTLIRHYKAFLELLKSFNRISLSVKPNSRSLEKKELNKVNDKDRDYLRAMRTKPFLLLAGISGTGKSRIVKQMAFDSCPNNAVLRSDPTSPGNYCLIEVKPNWHDSTELLGYESKIGGAHYQLTPFIKFLAKAMLYPDIPFFVCLDEMNLAPVEQYFAEFLSVLESRTKLADGHIVSEPLIKASVFNTYEDNIRKALFDKDLYEIKAETTTNELTRITNVDNVLTADAQKVYEDLKKFGLRIPENVVVIGTVNMDETTHQFSRKVIDRAMTIEMNLPEGNPFKDFFDNSSDLAYKDEPINASSYLPTETKAKDVILSLNEQNAEKTEWLRGEIAEVLTRLNNALDNTPFKVAYRVQNELLLYFYQLWEEDTSADWSGILNTSVDQILMMKVLPRIEGDEELLEKPLNKLIEFAEPYTNAKKKLEEMKSRLDQSRFTSFWP